MDATVVDMATNKSTGDRHKPRRMVGVPERIAAELERMAAEREASLAEMVKNACLFFLEHNNRWPPPAKPRPRKLP